MSATTSPPPSRAALAAVSQRRATRRATRSMAVPSLLVGTGFWVFFATAAVVVPFVVDRAGGHMDVGVLVAAEYSARWFAFSLGLITCSTILATHLAAGGTRRALRDAALVTAVVTAPAYGVLRALATVAEREVFRAVGWPWSEPEGGLATGSGGVLATAGAEVLVVVVYVLVGCAVAIGYTSDGPWRGTLLLLPGLVLLGLVELATRSGWATDVLGSLLPDEASGTVAGIVVALAAIGLSAVWLHLRLRTVRLRPTR
ncbi:hypothetical protein UQW22_08250 [Isoptericola halotolerans]|uniref:hypothetical protein n=1 Tax=Isoptericola halotolerans TaxID=300560 RepID=UPI00388D2D59